MDIYTYRAQKEAIFAPFLTSIQKQADFDKKSIRSSYGFVDCYIYCPKQIRKNNLPICFNFHGGGFVLGYPEQDNDYCRFLADNCQMMVVNVDYLLAPEYPFPIAIESSVDVIRYFIDHAEVFGIDEKQIFLSGSSAGGNLIFGINELLIRNYSIISRALISNYGAMDLRGSYMTEDYAVNRYSQYVTTYLNNSSETDNPLASVTLLSPYQGQKVMLNLAEKDPLLPQEEIMYNSFKCKGSDIVKHIYIDAEHGFLHPMYDEFHEIQSLQAYKQIVEFISNCLKPYDP